MDVLTAIQRDDVMVRLVEQGATRLVRAHRGYVMETGRIVHPGRYAFIGTRRVGASTQKLHLRFLHVRHCVLVETL
jgi:ABC-type branched-subunit amino acid transport system ATPase component